MNLNIPQIMRENKLKHLFKKYPGMQSQVYLKIKGQKQLDQTQIGQTQRGQTQRGQPKNRSDRNRISNHKTKVTKTHFQQVRKELQMRILVHPKPLKKYFKHSTQIRNSITPIGYRINSRTPNCKIKIT